MSWRRFWRAETGVFLGIWLALMLMARSSLLRDPGTFWHVKVGQRMIESREVIQTDPFSFTRGGQPWVAHQWLAECGMAVVHRLSGFDGLLLVTATLLAGLYTWVASRLARAGFHLLLVGLVLALVLLASSHQFHARPLIFTIALLGVTFSLLVDVEAGRKRLPCLWWLVPLVALWANLHAGVLAGIGTLAVALLGWSLAWALGKDSPVRRGRDLIALAALLLACGLAVLVNPYGLDLPRAWLKTLTIPLPELIQEHGPVYRSTPLLFGTLLLLGLGYLVALAGVLPKWPRVTWLLPLVWLILAVGRVRNVPLFAITAVIAAAELLPASRWAGWLQGREWLLPKKEKGTGTFCAQPGTDRRLVAGRWGRRCLSPFRSSPAALLPLLLVVTVALLQIAGVRAPVVGRGWARLDPASWPVDDRGELLPELERINRASPEGTPIFNDMAFGGFLIYHTPRLRVFIDDRCALYGSEFLQEVDRARREDPAQIDRWQQQYGFRYALVETDVESDRYEMKFDRHLEGSDQWQIIRRTPVATLYERVPAP
ncbi:MAG: hypothetical protein ACYSWU_13030 [Planctomycetota bacterium]